MYKSNFDELVKQYHPMLLKLIKNKFVDGYDKDDLYQECLMVMDKCNKDYDEEKNIKFSTYLYASIKNKLFDLIKHVNRDKIPSLVFIDDQDLALIGEVLSEDPSDYSEEDINNLFSKITTELLKMERGYITYMIYVGGLTVKTIADMEHISLQRVKFLNKRNIEKLKKIIN